MNSEKLKQLVIEALEDVKGQDIVALDVKKQTDIADHMIVASGTTSRQVKALADSVVVKAKAEDVSIIGVEGMDTAEWVLVDLVDVIVHVMLPKVRAFYDLERLWSLGPNRKEEEQG